MDTNIIFLNSLSLCMVCSDGNRPLSRGSHFVSGDLKSFVYARLALRENEASHTQTKLISPETKWMPSDKGLKLLNVYLISSIIIIFISSLLRLQHYTICHYLSNIDLNTAAKIRHTVCMSRLRALVYVFVCLPCKA